MGIETAPGSEMYVWNKVMVFNAERCSLLDELDDSSAANVIPTRTVFVIS